MTAQSIGKYKPSLSDWLSCMADLLRGSERLEQGALEHPSRVPAIVLEKPFIRVVQQIARRQECAFEQNKRHQEVVMEAHEDAVFQKIERLKICHPTDMYGIMAANG